MARAIKVAGLLGLAAIVMLAAGFAGWIEAVRRFPSTWGSQADGIVVLTGGEERIAAGLDLLGAGRARRMLISGVDQRNRTPEQLLRRFGEGTSAARCCVDLGHLATNTIGNASEAARWAAERGYRRLIIVTSSHHMPRSLAEFERALPGTTLIAHPVAARYVNLASWWSDRTSARVLVGEYLKFVLASARIHAARVVETLASAGSHGSATVQSRSPSAI